MKIIRLLLTTAALSGLAACSKSEPDNAMTRYAEGLAQDQQAAKVVANKANAVIAKENKAVDQANQANQQETQQMNNQPQ